MIVEQNSMRTRPTLLHVNCVTMHVPHVMELAY